MTFLQLFRREMHSSLPRLVFMAGLGGVSSAALLAAINAGAQAANSNQERSLGAAGLFVVGLFLFIKCQNYLHNTAAGEIESIIHKLRVRVLDEVRRSELAPLERIGRARIVAGVTTDTVALTQAANMLPFLLQNAVLFFFVGLYMAYLSFIGFLISIGIIAVCGTILYVKGRALTEGQREASEWTNRLFDRLTDVLDGFKEVRLNKPRSDQLIEEVSEVSSTAADIKIKTDARNFQRTMLAQIAIYLLLGAVVFVAPQLGSVTGGSINKTILALFFIVGASFGLVQSIPMFASANAAAGRIEQLEADLLATARSAEISTAEMPKRFAKIEVRDVVYRYLDRFSETTFQVGPVDFTLESGDLVFITGGNGSGKSTFLKVLAGLYIPEAGRILLDGARIDDDTRERYRALITAIFSDYHLFSRLYGIHNPDPAEVERLLAQFELSAKTRLSDGEFRNLDLSTGQRKRLALIVALLEKRPILLLDEWASEQDPEFRRKFYNDVLRDLNRGGVTIVAVTHDDRYLKELDLVARILRMEDGRFAD